jgi:branched-chain amino acid transport system ATP-binding protein
MTRASFRSYLSEKILMYFGLIVLLLFPIISQNSYYLRLVTTIGLYVILAMGLNVTVGLGGLLDMGYVAFYALGAYTHALLASPHFGFHLPSVFTMLLAIVIGVVLSLIIGVPNLRLRGDYLAVVTMGFAEILRIFLVNLDRPLNITNGPNGITRIDPVQIGPVVFDSPFAVYYLVLTFALLALKAFSMILHSKTGLYLRAMKEDPIAAESMGINTSFYRILAFVVGSVFASVAGVLFASWQSAVFPQNFGLNELITLYCMVVLGGVGDPKGSLVGVTALTILPEVLRGYSSYRMLIYGGLLVTIMIFRPQGLFPSRVRSHLNYGAYRRKNRSRLSLPCTADKVILRAKSISRKFGGVTALEEVSFELKAGEILSIIGPNGAGKTTLINILSGIISPTAGEILIHGRSITGLSPHSIYQLGISRTFQNLRLFGNMTVQENVLVGAFSYDDAIKVLSLFIQDHDLSLDSPAQDLSFAHRKILEIARAVAGKPSVLLLDEPAAGMNPSEIDLLKRFISYLRDMGYSIILVEHQMDLVMQISDRILVLDQGKKIAEGAPQDVAEDPLVAKVYLGEPEDEFLISTLSNCSNEKSILSPPVIELRNVETSYGYFKILHGVNLTVREGEIVALLGPNGSGKTTTLRSILGSVPVSSGEILISNKKVNSLSPSQMNYLGVSVVPEGRRIFSRMTVEENLAIGALLDSTKIERKERLDRIYHLFPRLGERRKQVSGTLSGGEQQMLAIGRALMANPRIILLDEPSMGLAPLVVEEIYQVMSELNKERITILMVEQNARRALTIAHRGYVLRNGQIIKEGTAKELYREGVLEAAYLVAN